MIKTLGLPDCAIAGLRLLSIHCTRNQRNKKSPHLA
jgi:hypothetical protein